MTATGSTLVFLALLDGGVVWWLVRQTINVKPWVASGNPSGRPARAWDSSPAESGVGLIVLLAVITSLFALFVSAY